MNKYDLEHACTAHPLMSKETWTQVYADAWKRYYTDEHVETIMRRAVVSGINRTKVLEFADHLLRRGPDRGGASAAIRIFPPQIPQAAPLRHAGA